MISKLLSIVYLTGANTFQPDIQLTYFLIELSISTPHPQSFLSRFPLNFIEYRTGLYLHCQVGLFWDFSQSRNGILTADLEQ